MQGWERSLYTLVRGRGVSVVRCLVLLELALEDEWAFG
jgi:hypothetical protein